MSTFTRTTTQGERLARSRMFVGISQGEIANMLGRSKGTVSNWENDHVDPPLSAMAQWARLTGRTIDWIAFGDEDDKTPTAIGGGQMSLAGGNAIQP